MIHNTLILYSVIYQQTTSLRNHKNKSSQAFPPTGQPGQLTTTFEMKRMQYYNSKKGSTKL